MTKSRQSDLAGLVFVAALFIGLAGGLAFGRPDVGVLLGLGVGFAAMALVKLRS
jgi:hypothetical protein